MKYLNKTTQMAIQCGFLLLTLFAALPCFAQAKIDTISASTPQNFPTWEGGVFFGAGLIYGDLTSDVGVISGAMQPAYGLFAMRNFQPNWAIRLNLTHSKLKANDLDANQADRRARGFSHETPLTELSILAQWDLRGKRRYQRIAHFKKTFSPYFFAGIAAGIGKPDVFYADQKDTPNALADQEDVSSFRIAIPIGGGIKFDLSQRSFIGIEFGWRPTFGDLLDGVSESGNPTENDWYAFGGITIGYRFASDDADGDGVVNAKDKCPGVAGERQFRGCPDTDGDGVRDKDDNCPLIAGAKTMNGCPDTDLDGVADTEDECPNVKGMQRLQGCPDADWDNVIDDLDACPNTLGLAKFKGCPDTDLDGVMDLEDQCPEIAGLLKFKGCPDGIAVEEVMVEDISESIPEVSPSIMDEKNQETTNSEPVKINESVLEDLQKSVLDMPTTMGSNQEVEEKKEVEKNVAKEDTPILYESKKIEPTIKIEKEPYKSSIVPTFEMIRFATASNELSASNKSILDEAASTLSDFPTYKLVINGYTDDIGNEILNDQLSEKRARACFNYLLEKGVDRNRMTFKGFGEMSPITTNATAVGRAKNRRVEIYLAQ